MQNIYVNGRFRNEYESDFHSNEHYLRNSENKAWKKIWSVIIISSRVDVNLNN